ncbi:hypothetical protein SAMN05216553_13115 [Lentzea fradiae]|uniref:Uncharacterized protein n=1 Tax=Lentzea fradiae TaxID=200378 RepID=A0A1G8DM03_9PSEU|nr:hypothetical protein SAMN05216553_13115 [Lentzea fradiae]
MPVGSRLLARLRYRLNLTATHPVTGRVRMEYRDCSRCPGGGWFRKTERRPLCSWCRALAKKLAES